MSEETRSGRGRTGCATKNARTPATAARRVTPLLLTTRGGLGRGGASNVSQDARRRVATFRGSAARDKVRASKIKLRDGRRGTYSEGAAARTVTLRLAMGLAATLATTGEPARKADMVLGGWRVWVCAGKYGQPEEQESTTCLSRFSRFSAIDVGERTHRNASFGAIFRFFAH